MIAYWSGVVRDTLSQTGPRAHGAASDGEIASVCGERGDMEKMQNSGNEAKKWLKTKHITFLE